MNRAFETSITKLLPASDTKVYKFVECPDNYRYSALALNSSYLLIPRVHSYNYLGLMNTQNFLSAFGFAVSAIMISRIQKPFQAIALASRVLQSSLGFGGLFLFSSACMIAFDAKKFHDIKKVVESHTKSVIQLDESPAVVRKVELKSAIQTTADSRVKSLAKSTTSVNPNLSDELTTATRLMNERNYRFG